MARLTQISILAIVAATGCQEAGETIGPRGGTVVSDDGRFSLEIAPGALEHDVDITITAADCDAMGVTAVGPCYTVGPRGTGFLFPAKVTYELDGELELAELDELAVSTRREHNWKLLADRVVDVEDGTLTASAVYLSSFAIVNVTP
ncbi:MAG: hypothetical protein IAG13_34650 [Deltaproteobacteria bacterium]|nr:hypothetical protein [Nannocystaceae bacterium]